MLLGSAGNQLGTHQVMAYACNIDLTDDDIRTIEISADMLLNACKDIGLAVNTGKTGNRISLEHGGKWAYCSR
jgi:hypothetical protein